MSSPSSWHSTWHNYCVRELRISLQQACENSMSIGSVNPNADRHVRLLNMYFTTVSRARVRLHKRGILFTFNNPFRIFGLLVAVRKLQLHKINRRLRPPIDDKVLEQMLCDHPPEEWLQDGRYLDIALQAHWIFVEKMTGGVPFNAQIAVRVWPRRRS